MADNNNTSPQRKVSTILTDGIVDTSVSTPADQLPKSHPEKESRWACGTSHTHQKLMKEFNDIKVAIDIIKYSSNRVECFGDAISHLFIFNRNFVPNKETSVSNNPEHISVPNPTYDPSISDKFKTVRYPIKWEGPYGCVNFYPSVVSVQMISKMEPLPANYILYGNVWFTDKPRLIKKLVSPVIYWTISQTRHILDDSLDKPNPFNAVNIKGMSMLKLVINGITIVNLTKTLMIMYKKFIDPNCYIMGNCIINPYTYETTMTKYLSKDVRELLGESGQDLKMHLELTYTKVFTSS